MTSTLLAPTIPPRVRLDADHLPVHDALTVLAGRERRRVHPQPHVAGVYTPARRNRG